jgi:hypothetical protein
LAQKINPQRAAEVYAELRDKFKTITAYTDEELDATIHVLGNKYPFAYEILNFIDAYFERRKRKLEKAKAGTPG